MVRDKRPRRFLLLGLFCLLFSLNARAPGDEFPYVTVGDKDMGEAGYCLEFEWMHYINLMAEDPLAEWSGIVTGKEAHILESGFVSNTCFNRVAIISCHPKFSGHCDSTMRKWSWTDKGITTVYPVQNLSASRYSNFPYRSSEWVLTGYVYLACFMKDRETNPKMAFREVENGLACLGVK